MLNQMQVMNNVMEALDGPGVEPKLWSEMQKHEMRRFCKEYIATLKDEDRNSLIEDADIEFYTKIARHADRNKKLVGIVLG